MGSPPRFLDGLPTRATVCGICRRHLGSEPSKVRQRDRDHLGLYAEDLREGLEERETAHAAVIAQLQGRIDELQAS
jgi:hypothetical protein